MGILNINFRRKARAEPSPPPARAPREQRRDQRRKVKGWGKMAWIAGDGIARAATVHFQDASERGAAVQVGEQVPVGHMVWLLLKNGADFRGVTRNCRAVDDGFLVGIRILPEKRSRQPGSTHMKWIDSAEKLHCTTVSIRRKQASEVQVTIDEAVPTAKLVLLVADDEVCLGSVRRTEKQGDQHRLGVELLPETYLNRGELTASQGRRGSGAKNSKS